MEPRIYFNSVQMNTHNFTKDLDIECDQAKADCLSVTLILREVFQHFSSTELLELSLVNKRWNYEARSLMRTRGNIIASINKNQTCQDLRAFASDLRRMKKVKIVPFAGLTISVGGRQCHNKDHCQQSPNRELEPVYEEILSGLTWKRFSIGHLPGWEEHKSCPGFILQNKLLKTLDSVLEELSIQLEPNEAKSFKDEFLTDCYFPRLKTFRLLNEQDPFEPEWSDLIKTVVANAPNLQVLYTKTSVDLNANLLEGSSAVHVAASSYSPSRNEFPESVGRGIQMHGMHLLGFSSDFNLERFNRITSTVLQSSRKIMSSIYADVSFLAPLMNYGICLENLRTFHLVLDPLHLERTRSAIGRIARSFDFTRMFPNLNTVTITIFPETHHSIPEGFNEMTEHVNAVMGRPARDRVANIKHLKLDYPLSQVIRRRFNFRFLARMFPKVQKLSIDTTAISFADVRGIWSCLEEVEVTLQCSRQSLTNLDSLFCGIFPEEAAQLREKDEEYLRRVNIVPVMPSIAYLKKLRTFKVHYEKGVDVDMGPTGDPTCLFSKVTPLIAFQRCPNLTVTLTTEDDIFEQALSHLRPYASVVLEKKTLD